MYPILLLSPDPATARGVAESLGGRFPIHLVRSTVEAHRALADSPSLQAVVLALAPALPQVELDQAGKFAARWGKPVVVLTSRRDGSALEELFDAGADECLADDVPAAELGARLTATVRRAKWSAVRPIAKARAIRVTNGFELVVGRLVLGIDTRTAIVDGRPLHLSKREFDLLAHLARRPGEVVGRAELLDELWGGQGTLRVVNTCVTRLRRRLEESAGASAYLQVVHGVGVKLAAPAPTPETGEPSSVGRHRAGPGRPMTPDQVRQRLQSC